MMRTAGMEVSIEEIAATAGVGPSTFYRHFPSKDALLAALLEELGAGAREIAEQASRLPDPWQAFAFVFSNGCVLDPDDLLMFDQIARVSRELGEQAESETASIVTVQVTRAQRAGVLRGDVDATDVAALMRAADGGTPEQRERRVKVLLQGLRPASDLG
ncbi:TetR/AcrR family transcriptional regulator [Rhodococcus spelaei]|uniref:TetR/AcrR family transcriptional regulator n=1 Tax=Rhodococcus spelaei TaxID=2546320 RepID=A0A541BAB8_9NOCA|nr:TetR/AcrR family transcriptional regulator [Rhodococcus spelaei]